MKKILKVKIKRTVGGGKTHYDYPPEYDVSKISVLRYESQDPDGMSDVKGRGDKDEYCIGVVNEADVPAFLISKDIEEITSDVAKALGPKWYTQVDKISDPNKILAIVAKQARGEVLTQEEKDALDPDNPESGINKTPTWDEIIDESIA